MDQHDPSREQDKSGKSEAQLEREEEYKAVIEPDPVLDEVGRANRNIPNPTERRRVVPSKPCDKEHDER